MIRPNVRRLFHLGLRRPGEVGPEIDEEIAVHLEERARQLEAEGLGPGQARAEALRRFGPLPEARAGLMRAARGRERSLRLRDRLEALGQDFRHARRSLAGEPGLVVVVALVIALGVGANAAVFGVVDRLLLRGPDHVREPERVRRLYYTADVPGIGPFTTPTLGYVAYTTLRDRTRSFSALAAYSYSTSSTRTLGAGAEAEQVLAADATASLFPLLGVRPALGRFFDAEEDRPGAARRVVVLGHTLWQRRFGGDRDVLGRTVGLEAIPHTVIGVAPPGFTGAGLGRVDVWLPMSLRGPTLTEDWQTTAQVQWLEVLARLEPAVSATRANADATRVLRRVFAAEGDEVLGRGHASLLPLRYDAQGREAMEVAVSRWLAGVALIVLLVACANVANLLAARALRQRRELAVRAALGVTTARLIRLLVAQSLLLAALGGLAALAVMPAASRLLRSTLLPHVEWQGAALDGRAVLVAALVTLAAGLLTGLAPALTARRADLLAAIKSGAREVGGPTSRLRLALTVAQAAFSVMLLVVAGLFAGSLWRAESVDLGIEPERVLAVGARWPRDPRAEPEVRRARERAFYARALELARRHPGVESAAIAVGTPFHSWFSVPLRVPGWEELPRLPGGGPNVHAVTVGYLDTVGLRLLRGRDFTADDRAGSEPVAMVNQTMAETLWRRGEALGACLHVGEAIGSTAPCSRVVGVVQDAHRESLEEPPAMQYYVPLGQEVGFGGSRLLVRPRGEPAALAEPLRQALLPLDAGLLWLQAEPLDAALEPELRPLRLGAVLIGVLGLLALLVAALGLYSLVAHSVASRARELAVHVALGARRGAIVALVLRGGLGLAALGLLVGILVSLVTGPRLGGLLFHTSPRDPLVYLAVVVTLLAAATTACLPPARRALRIQPARVLRDE